MSDKYDVLIIGGGPAGISAALTCRNRGKSTAVIANSMETSSLYKAESVTNYPGQDALSGREMLEAYYKQLRERRADTINGRALSAVRMGKSFGVAVGNDFYQCSALIVAAGITRENLYAGEAEFLGRGVSYCATCDGMLYRGKTVALIGSNAEADADEAFLSSIGCTVSRFSSAGKYEIRGGAKADTLVYKDEEYMVDGVFIIKDTVSVTQLVEGLEYINGGIVTDRSMATTLPGVFAAGDCTGKPYQVGKAVGEGNIAALSACGYIDLLHKGER